MSVPTITGVHLGGADDLPLLVCGPSLGTSVTALWSATAALLNTDFHIVGWDLPGHGSNHPEVTGAFTMAELAEGVLAAIDGALDKRGECGTSVLYAGDSVGGAVGQQLLLDHPSRIRAAVLACTAARIGDEAMWRERADLVRASGTAVMVDGSVQRWFGPGFIDREPAVADALLQSLRTADRFGYAAVCEALATFDVRSRVHRIDAPVIALAGAHDVAAPVTAMAELAHGVAHGRLVVLDDVAHLAPAEAPAATAEAIREVAAARRPR